jgi:hypothetical protein
VTVVDEPLRGKSVLRESSFSAQVETFTIKDALRRPAFHDPRRWPQWRCHRSRRIDRQPRKNGRSTKYFEFGDTGKFNIELHWYKNWSLESWRQEPHSTERKRSPKVASVPHTRQPRIKKVPTQQQVCRKQVEALCNAMSWKTEVIIPSDLECIHKRQQDHEFARQSVNCSLPSRCVVCFEEAISLHDAGCGHGLCLECWGQYGTAKMEEGSGVLNCPVPGCACPAPDEVVKCMLSEQAWKQLTALRNDAVVSSNPSLCYCPDPHCGRVLQMSTEDVAVVQCPCGGAWCPKCKGPAHWPASCQDRRWWDTNQGKLVSTTQEHTKTCPACFVEIEKNGGCNQMTCRMCRTHFCWQCGSHSTTLPFFS